jgi:hypothetical protein
MMKKQKDSAEKAIREESAGSRTQVSASAQ